MFDHFTVRARLLAGFMLISVIGALVAAVGIYDMSKMNEHAELAYSSDLLGVSAVKDANVDMIVIARAMRNVLLATSPADKKKYQEAAEHARKAMQEHLTRARPLFRSTEASRLFGELDKGLAEYDAGRAQLSKLAEDATPEGHAAAVEFMFGPLAGKAAFVDEKLGELTANKEKMAAADAREATELYRNSRLVLVVLVLVSLGTGIGIGLWITRGLTRQLGGEPAYAVEIAGAIGYQVWKQFSSVIINYPQKELYLQQ